jgi:hypothetical protein
MMSLQKGIGCLAILLLLGASAFAQDGDGGAAAAGEAASGAPDFGMGVGIGVQSFTDPESGETETYQSLALKPDVALGKLGIGLDVTVNYRFTGGEAGNEFEIREEDWIPDDETNFFELYLPKIQYVRWARKGDPLFVQLGALPSARLGNGFIVSGYANTLYRPERPLFGMQLDVDGKLFDFPYVGVETFAGNLAAFDLFGARLFARPLADSESQILQGLQVGSTFVTDQDPFYFYEKDPDADQSIVDDSAQVSIWGVDVRQPILTNDIVSLSAFGDFVQQDDASGGMVGVGGRFISILPYRAEIRLMGDNFIPQYFSSQYDLFRVDRYQVYSADQVEREAHAGWLASTGFSILSDRISLNITMEGPFGNYEGVYPTLRGSFMLAQGLVPGFSFEANYAKEEITEPAEVFDPENAVIGAQVNYQTGPAVISLIYDLEYDPTQTDNTPWNVTTRLESTISLF